MKNFEVINKLGDGAYSEVFKVKRKIDNKIYALKNEIKRNDKESNNNISSNNESGNDNNINNFGLGDDENFGSMLNESDGFDKLINQLKQEKIEEDRNYEKQKKAKERQNEKEKIKEEEYDLNNLIYNFNNTNINNDFSKKEEKKD